MKKIIASISLVLFSLTYAMQEQPIQVPRLDTLALSQLVRAIQEGRFDRQGLLDFLNTTRLDEKYKIALFRAALNQGVPVQEYISPVGLVTRFSDGSIKISNYLGKGGTFFLSADKEEHLELDALGNPVRSSLERKPRNLSPLFKATTTEQSEYFKHNDGTIEKYSTVINPDIPVLEVHLDIIYPDGIIVHFDYHNSPSRFSYDTQPALALFSAIERADAQLVARILEELKKQHKRVHSEGGVHFLTQALKKVARGDTSEAMKEIIRQLVLAGAKITAADEALLASNTQVRKIFEQVISSELFKAITEGSEITVNKIIDSVSPPGIKKQILTQIVTTSVNYAGQTPLVYAFVRALKTQDQGMFEKYLRTAQLLINNGAALVGPEAEAFMQHWGTDYQSRIVPFMRELARLSEKIRSAHK